MRPVRLTIQNPTNCQKNILFLNKTDKATKDAILKNIADHYGLTSEAAYDAVTDVNAEHLLEYVTGPQRSATHVLMQRHGLM